jgi:hypothetical protein
MSIIHIATRIMLQKEDAVEKQAIMTLLFKRKSGRASLLKMSLNGNMIEEQEIKSENARKEIGRISEVQRSKRIWCGLIRST